MNSLPGEGRALLVAIYLDGHIVELAREDVGERFNHVGDRLAVVCGI